MQALTAGFFFNAAKLQRSGNYRTIKNKQTVHMHLQNGLAEVCLGPLSQRLLLPRHLAWTALPGQHPF